jgi:hypothetical protein
MSADYRNLAPGQHRRPCPACARGKRDTALSVTVKADGVVLVFCHRCSYSERHDDRRRQAHHERPALHITLSEYGRNLWRECEPIAGTAADYLRARRCVIPPADGDLRWHPKLKHPSGHVGAALIALVTNAITGLPQSLHRTWINADGSKAAVDPPRMLLKGHTKAGGVIRLWPDESVTTGLSIGEGIETMLTVAHVFRPAWSCIDAGNLAQFPILDGIESLIVFRDNDPTGLLAGKECGLRWQRAGRDVKLVTPSKPGHDVNDAVREAVR